MTDYKTLSDNALVLLLRESDDRAFSEIFSRYKGLLISFTYRRLSNMEQTKDLIHDIFADIWEKRETINIPGELMHFLIVVIKNRIFDLYKHKKVSDRHLEALRTYLNNYESDADHLVRYNNLSALIEQEIAALPEKMRVVFELSRKKNMTRKEIAEALGLPESTVRTNMNRALKILRSKFGLVVYLTYFSHLAAGAKEEHVTITSTRLDSSSGISLQQKSDSL